MITVRYIPDIAAAEVFNLTAPRWLPELARPEFWPGRRPWHDPVYNPLRDLVEETYITLFEQATGHYSFLAESLLRDGCRNPVMLSAGCLLRRKAWELPPTVPLATTAVCEYLGGSRLMVAAKLGLRIPAIVNDAVGLFEGRGSVIPTQDMNALMGRFCDPPIYRYWEANGSVYVNNLPYVHYPPKHRISLAQQSIVRKKVVAGVIAEAVQWLNKHEGDSHV